MEIKPLVPANFNDFIFLLKERGKADDSFYQWKYLQSPQSDIPVGYIAYHEGKPIGCIGNINRKLSNKEGENFSSTWFADWYTTANARGTGAGKALMQKMATAAITGLGIPGPESAQIVAAKAGYQPYNNFYEVRIPLHPWRVGIRKFKGIMPLRILRGFKEMLTVRNNPFLLKSDLQLIFGQPGNEVWKQAVENGLQKKNHLKRENEFLNWFASMPGFTNYDRQWWYHQSKEMYACGFIEKYRTNLKQVKILELIFLKENDNELLKKLLYSLKQASADTALFILDSKQVSKLKPAKQWLKLIPLHITDPTVSRPEYLSLLDKESSWIDYEF